MSSSKNGDGLRRIRSRLILDVITLSTLFYCAVIPPNIIQTILLSTACSFTCLTVGLTRRWTITLPMIPYVALQIARRFDFAAGAASVAILVGSCSSIALAVVLSLLLFPAVELPPVRGKYHVGVIDFDLPVEFDGDHATRSKKKSLGKAAAAAAAVADDDTPDGRWKKKRLAGKGHVIARLLYPTTTATTAFDRMDGSIPYMTADVAGETMKCGAPPLLRKLSFMMHTWCLVRLRAKRDAKPLHLQNDRGQNGKEGGGMPVAVYSHGLLGCLALYSYQALSLAANGTVVLMIDHTDGSAPLVKRGDGTKVFLNDSFSKLWQEGKEVQCVRARRSQTEYRVAEFIAATLALLDMNHTNIPCLEARGISFVNKLNTNDVTFMGHSFGGATALTAAKRRPDLVSCIVAHEPAVDWMPDDARRALFPERKFVNSPHGYSGGTGGYESTEWRDDTCEEKKDVSFGRSSSSLRLTLHDIDMLFLYSHQWDKNGWTQLTRSLYERGELGPPNGVSDFHVIEGACHQEFSDTCILLPLWLGRKTGVTGTRNPINTAEEIAKRTLIFVENVRRKIPTAT